MSPFLFKCPNVSIIMSAPEPLRVVALLYWFGGDSRGCTRADLQPLYDDYGPVRPGLLRRSAVPSPEGPTTPAIVRLWKQFARHGHAFYRPSGILLSTQIG